MRLFYNLLVASAVFAIPFATLNAQDVGELDLSYGTNGVRVFTPATEEYPLALVLRPNGGEFIVGSTLNGNTYAVIRAITSSGAPDVSFSGTGVRTIISSGETIGFREGALDANGKLVLFGGAGTEADGYDIMLQRLNTNGTNDNVFGGADAVRLTYPGGAVAETGAVLAGGTVAFAAGPQAGGLLIGEVNGMGNLNTAFGTGGFALVDLDGGGVDEIGDLLVQPDGKLLVSLLLTYKTMDPPGTTALVVRLLANGQPDASFGDNGRVYFAAGPGYVGYGGMHLLPDGFIAITVSVDTGFDTVFQPTLISPTGEVLCSTGDPVTPEGYGVEISVPLSNTEVLAISGSYNGNSRLAVVEGGCFVNDAFGTDGYTVLDLGLDVSPYPNDAVLRSDGRVDVLLSVFNFATLDAYPVVARLHGGDVVGVAEHAPAATITVVPQPVIGDELFLAGNDRVAATLRLVDMTGRSVADLHTAPAPDGRHRIALPGAVNNGSYVLQGVVGGQPFAKPLIVRR